MAESSIPKKGVAFEFYMALVDTANRPDFKAAPTLAAGDVQVSKDGGAFANISTLPTVTPAAGIAVKVELSSSEMNADHVVVKFIDAAGGEWDDELVEIRPATRKLEDLAFPATSGRSINVTASGAITNVTTLDGHTVQTGDSYARLGAPAGASVSADIATVDGNVDTLLSRITSTLFSGITSLAEWLGLLAGKQTGDSTARTELRATGAGSGTFDETTDSQEAIKDSAAGGGASAQEIWDFDITGTAAGANRAGNVLNSADANIVTVDTVVDGIKAVTDNLPDSGSLSDLATLLARLTAARAGYLDNLNGHTAQTGDNYARLGAPTNASIAADIAAIVTAIITQNDLSAAEVRSALGLSSANLDTQLSNLASDITAILADTGTTGVVISTTTAQAIADQVLSRSVSNTEDTAGTASLTELILGAFEFDLSGGTWTIKKTGGTTFNTRTVGTDAAADPITSST